jgi:DNA-binding NtrC family response regulator
VYRRKDGEIARRRATFVSLGDDANNAGVFVVVAVADEIIEPQQTPAAAVTSVMLHEQLQQLAYARGDRYRLDPWVGEGIAMRRVREQISIAVASQATLTIVGSQGVGKEFLARAIHHASSQSGPAASPLLPLGSALLDAELLQSTIVAFLRRQPTSRGALPPTILLLDADQLSAPAQAELLGFCRIPTFDFRVIATARQSLRSLAAQGRFERELASRLTSLEIELPRLADRREDIPLLAQRIVEHFNSRGGKQVGGCAAAVLDILGAMPWERNLEELTEVLEHGWQAARGPLIEESDLPQRVGLMKAAAEYPASTKESVELDAFLQDVERELIARALKQWKGNKSKAAKTLGIQRARLLRRMAQLGLTGDAR